jgi:hypothetical protein
MRKRPNIDRKRVLERWILYAAVLSAVTIAVLSAVFFGTSELIVGVLASVLTLICAYIFTQTVFRSANEILTQDEVDYLSKELVARLRADLPAGANVASGWYDLPWKDLLGETQSLEFAVSYMDTWINQATDGLSSIFDRGGTVTAYLPKPGSEAANRVVGRFPEYSPELVTEKITNTAVKLRAMLARCKKKGATLEIYWTDVFNMYCLMSIDERYLMISPYDHFRRGKIEAPTFLIPIAKSSRWYEWARKEFDGFREGASLEKKSVA